MDECGGCTGDPNVWDYLKSSIIYFDAATSQCVVACNHVVITVLLVQLTEIITNTITPCHVQALF